MRIKRLELRGFKSFVDATAFHLGPGISAVVGPNGCGKSNVIDAIRWTLGEQSPSTLRGKAMSDVIFAGSEGRAPSNVCEVSLIFDNADGGFGGRHARYAEIEVTRRLDRAGNSTYSLNRERCRLKDIVDLFVDTGVGARAYSIIEQGRVGFVVSARPEERRLLVDEVAGVNRFKGQRAEAERRMKETRANLARVADLEGEMDRQRSSLEEQARKAARFVELRRRYKEVSLRAHLLDGVDARWSELGSARRAATAESVVEGLEAARGAQEDLLSRARVEASEAQEQLASHRERRATLEATLVGADERGRDHEERARALRESIAELERRSQEDAGAKDRSEARLGQAGTAASTAREQLVAVRRRLEEAQEARSRQQQQERAARAALEEVKQRQLECMTAAARHRNSSVLLKRRLEDIAEERRADERGQRDDAERAARAAEAVAVAEAALTEARARREATKAERDRAASALTRLVDAAQDAVDRWEAAVSERTRREAAVRAEADLVDGLAGAEEGTRALAEWLRTTDSEAAAGFIGLVADLLVVPPELEAAVELALGERVDALVFASPESLREAVSWARAHRPGRATLILLGDEGPASGLAAQVESHPSAPGLAAQLLGGVEVVEGLSAIPATGNAVVLPPNASAHGLEVSVGPPGRGTQALARRARLRGMEQDLAAAEAAVDEAAAARRTALDARRQAQGILDAATAQLHARELAELGGRRDLESATRAAKALADEVTRSATRAQRLEEMAIRLRGELERVQADLVSAEARRSQLDGELEVARREGASAEAALAAASQGVTEAQLALADARHDAATAERDLRRLQEEVERGVRERERVGRELESARRRLVQVDQRMADFRASAEAARAELEGLRDLGPSLTGRSDAARAAVETATQALAGTRAELTAARRESRDARAKAVRAEAELAHLVERVEEEFAVKLLDRVDRLLAGEGIRVQVTAGPGRPPVVVELAPQEPTPPSGPLHSEAGRLAREAEAMGAVNMAAAEEFAEVDARWRELKGQREDLEAALADLKRAIGHIERETRHRFREAFDAVSQRFGALYPRLVGGGRAELALTDPEDLLATGVEIRVEPPGKRLQNLQLLSGGEKAMAAIAFVFAIFEVKPSPFCLLDEVDAPLDEANSRRFNGMLAELATTTQFVVITHNRTTMEVADVLYGVTMQTAGVSSVVSVRVDGEEARG